MLINRTTLESIGYSSKDAFRCMQKLYQNCPSGITKQVRVWKRSARGNHGEHLVSQKHVDFKEAITFLASYTLESPINYKTNMEQWKVLYEKLQQLKG